MFPNKGDVVNKKDIVRKKKNPNFLPKHYFLDSVNYRRSSGWKFVAHWLEEKKLKALTKFQEAKKKSH